MKKRCVQISDDIIARTIVFSKNDKVKKIVVEKRDKHVFDAEYGGARARTEELALQPTEALTDRISRCTKIPDFENSRGT